MRRIILCLSLATLIVLVLVVSYVVHVRIGWVEYEPIVWSEEKDDWVREPELMKTDHVMAIMLVLSSYGQPFRFEPGCPADRIYITRRLAANEELVWNFTSKAETLRKAGHLSDLDTWWNLPTPQDDNVLK